MGDEGLRRAKESYKPDILLEKNTVMEKYPLADFEDQDRIKEETRELWKQVFNDSEKFMDLYFNRVYQPKYNITCQINRHVVAALQTLPYTLLYHGSEVKTAYISGVSTHPDFRQQGVADNLMRQAHFDLFYKEVVFATLIPAEKWLYEWYGRCGYAEQITCTPPPTGIEKMNFETFDKLQRTKNCVLLHDREGFDIIQEDIRLAGADYHPATQPVQAMIRVVNVKRALELYLKHHPETNTVLRVEDDHDIPMNNAYYILKSGRVKKTDEPDANALRLRIEALADFIFKDEGAEMNLMLNE